MKKFLAGIALALAVSMVPSGGSTAAAQTEIDFGPGVGGCDSRHHYVIYWDEHGIRDGCLLGVPA